jgi:gamma-glutamylcyclotransferase (GGCT)/AIG2-like uncharacterized protein YtfP
MMPHAPNTSRLVFVYGTLRAGGSNDIRRFAPAPVPMGEGSINGVLYDLGAYPGCVLGGSGIVQGEIYAVEPAVEAALDRLEDVRHDDSGEYMRREIGVSTKAGSRQCLVYEIHPSRIVGRPVIASGNWFVRAVPDSKT